MRNIGAVADARHAEELALILLGAGVASEVRPVDGDRLSIWILDEGQVDEARAWMSRWERGEDSAGLAELRRAGEVRLAEATRILRVRRPDPAAAVRAITAGPGVVTIGLLAIAGVVALLTSLGADHRAVLPWVISELPAAARLPEVRGGEITRLITPIFLHFGLMHIVFNGWMLYGLGSALEAYRGSTRFAVFVLASGVVSNLAQFGWTLATEPGRVPLFGGLSGVLYAVFGYAWWNGRVNPAGGLGVRSDSASYMLIWLVLCMTGLMGPIANAAHVGGLVCGVAWVTVEQLLRRVRG